MELPFYHDPVMPTEVIQDLVINPQGLYVDGTLGGGGHSNLLLSQFPDIKLFGFDRDPNAILHATQRLRLYGERFKAVSGRFSTMGEYFDTGSLDGILADLGISSRQVDDMERGFSFKSDKALDLRMNPDAEETAKSYLESNTESTIAKALYANSDIQKAHFVARVLKELLKENGDIYPSQLLDALKKLFPRQKDDAGSLAARVIQAIRMEINEEMYEVDALIASALKVLKPGGRLVFLTYHSVEDRRVKQGMAPLENPETGPKFLPIKAADLPQALFKKIHKKPLPPTADEIARNPRARSAKLRAYERL